MKKPWLKEIARDLLALGSIPFYFLVVIRAVIGDNSIFMYQMLIAALVIFIFYFIIKKSDLYAARSLVILFFISLFYKETFFTVFATLIWAFGIIGNYYLKKSIACNWRNRHYDWVFCGAIFISSKTKSLNKY